jgi:NADH dehydrogenase
MAVIGKAKAVVSIGAANFGGFLAWIIWALIHIAFLIGFRNRVQVLISWLWNWVLNSRDARLIMGESQLNVLTPRSPDFVRNNSGPDRHTPSQ